MLRLHLSPVPYAGRSDEGCSRIMIQDAREMPLSWHRHIAVLRRERSRAQLLSSQYIEHMPHRDLEFFFKVVPGLEKKSQQ